VGNPKSPLRQPDDTSIEGLRLRARVEALHADYAHAIDTDRLEEWPQFFTDDCVYKVVTRENHERGLPVGVVYCKGRGMLTDRITALRTANIYEPHVYCHLGGALRITGRAGGAITAESNFTVLRTMATGAMSVFACGRYLDRIVEDNGMLVLAERIAILDSRQIDTLLVIPI
jgi:anthranilate 1,2-dioxygenase small subunit